MFPLVKITKLQNSDDAEVTGHIEPGYTNYGRMEYEPTEGRKFTLRPLNTQPGMRGFRSSTVREILGPDTFKTYNSIYKWERITEDQLPPNALP